MPAGKRPTIKVRVRGRHNGVFVHVCESRRRDRDGMICHDEVLRRAMRQASRYWQAYRSWCGEGLDDCKAGGPVVKFKVR